MKPILAQAKLSELILQQSKHHKKYFWKVEGDNPNCLCTLLGVDWRHLRAALRACDVYKPGTESIRTNNLESLFQTRCGGELTQYKGEWFVKLGGHGKEVLPPNVLYNKDGELVVCPVDGEHVDIKKRNRGSELRSFVQSIEKFSVETKKQQSVEKIKKKSPREALISLVCDLVAEGARTGNKSIPPAKMKTLRRQLTTSVEEDVKKCLKQFMERIEKLATGMTKEEAATPDRIESIPAVTPTNIVSPQDLNVEINQEGDDDSVPPDVFLEDLKEEALLQSLLHKRMAEKPEQYFQMEHKNGKRLLVVCPPETRSKSTFDSEAKRTGWIDALLDSKEKREWMLSWLSKSEPEAFLSIAKKNKGLSIDLSTSETLALARVAGLNDSRLRALRSFLRHMANVNLQRSDKEVKAIDEEVGASRTQDSTFDQCVYEWSDLKGREKKASETVEHWTSSLLVEICAEVDLCLGHIHNDEKESDVPTIDCEGVGFPSDGVTVLIGGDHGDKNCPISAKINLSSPKKRKEMGDLGYHCPMVQFASIKCTKDMFDALANTVIPHVSKEIAELQTSSVITIFDKNNKTSVCRSYPVPATINHDLVAFVRNGENNVATYSSTRKSEEGSTSTHAGTIALSKELSKVPISDLSAKVVITRFNDLYIGDLAFLAMLLGMNNSDGDWCLLCHQIGSQFNCDEEDMKPRTKETLRECLEECLVQLQKKSNDKTKPANHLGVNSQPLIPNIDPQRIIVPILHCPMGLVDKVLERFMQFVTCDVERLNTELDTMRLEYKVAKRQEETALKCLKETEKILNDANKASSPGLKRLLDQAKKAKVDATKSVTSSKSKFEEGLKRHNARSSSLKQKFESICRLNSIIREHYHGGKFNGVNCIRIMEKARELFNGDENGKGGFLELCPQNKQDRVSDDCIRKTINQYETLLGMMDAIWSSVRGVEKGLLPSPENVQRLRTTINKCKSLWLEMGLTTLQPKWHLTFDGHLIEQYEKWGGLADKADDSIEHFHQILMRLRKRFQGSNAHKQKEQCVRRELRRKQSAKIQFHIDRYENKLKQTASSKRASDAKERRDNKKRIKQEKRDSYVDGYP